LIKNKICNYSLARLTPNKIAKFRNELSLNSAPATVNKYLTLISVAVNTAKNEWGIHLPLNPCTKIKRMEEPEVKDIRVQPEEEELLLKHAERSKKHWLKAIIIVALELGCRRGEKLSELDVKRSILRLGTFSLIQRRCTIKTLKII
jgi:integrase